MRKLLMFLMLGIFADASQLGINEKLGDMVPLDLTFIDEGNEDDINGEINFAKRELVYDIVQLIQTYQTSSRKHKGYSYDLGMQKHHPNTLIQIL